MRKPASSNTLLAQFDPQPVHTSGNVLTPGPYVLIGDHAGNAIPAALGDLGVAPADMERHIALDIGVAELGRLLGDRVAAPFVRQTYSRLVIDCNRDPARADSVPEESDGTPIPGNAGLGEDARRARLEAVFEPYHQAIAEALDAREAAGLETILVALHSFTPAMNGIARPWHFGVLYDRGDTSFAFRMLEWLRANTRRVVEGNEPYSMDDTDFTIPHHAYPRSLRYVEIEVRQDLIDPRTGSDVAEIAEVLAAALEGCARA